jgi:tetratricopeptide (TPR) repeat protein
MQDFDEAIRLAPQTPLTYFNRGITYLGWHQHEQAIQDFDEIIRLAPQFAKAYNLRGLAYFRCCIYQVTADGVLVNEGMIDIDDELRMGKLGSAFNDYDEAIRLDPQFASAYYNRGLAYHHLGPVHSELSIQDYEEAVRLDPQYADSYYEEGPLLKGTVIPPTSQQP